MASLNKVMFIGNFTRDPELTVTPKGTPVCKFSLASNRKFKDANGGEREEVTYVDFEAWGKQAENIQKYCTKGKPLFVEGRLRLDQWEDKTTKEKRSKMKVVVEDFQFLNAGPGAAGGNQAGEGGAPARYAPRAGNAAPRTAPRPASTPPVGAGSEGEEEALPF